MNAPIDVWNIGTFDSEVMSKLQANAQLIQDYLTTDQRLFEEREASDHRMPHAINPYGQRYTTFVEDFAREIMPMLIPLDVAHRSDLISPTIPR